MKRPVLAIAAAVFAAGALTACGTTHAADPGAAPKPAASEPQQHWQRDPASTDQKLPDVAKLCAQTPTACQGATIQAPANP
ncbi:hypothetical protein [Kitasatospora sp. NPDC004531]